MDGKVVVFTGGTSGIGEVAAVDLARQGARIILVARDRARASHYLGEPGRTGPGLAHRVVYADLASIAETRRAATEIAVAEPRIDVLVNNAGALQSPTDLPGRFGDDVRPQSYGLFRPHRGA